ncbi:MAG: hypothetical protein FP824_03800 [Euryarchaeota archaeon]|nr:hypothetical protein [Euryarchaeota archaeon]MBU4031899.1 hypothetical protein [Candidatus Thermoplasmatota archaeon]MBU4143324.1 hypothetical protein [Candidatus Thermoplasmatota archaeon]
MPEQGILRRSYHNVHPCPNHCDSPHNRASVWDLQEGKAMPPVIRPQSDYDGIALILSIVFCFVLVLIGIYFAVAEAYIPMIICLVAGAFFVFIVYGLKAIVAWSRLRRPEQ